MHDFIAKYIIARLAAHPGIEQLPQQIARIREDAGSAWLEVVRSGEWPYSIRKEDLR